MHPNSLANLIPPAKPGEVRNPKGREKLGAYVSEWKNSFACHMQKGTMTIDDLRKIAKTDPNTNRRSAAIRMLRDVEDPDIADFEPLLDGQQGLREMRAAGFDTRSIKRVKSKTRTITRKDGDPIVEVERELELRDTSLEEHKDLMDRTDGRPVPAASDLQTGNIIIQVNVSALGMPTEQPLEQPIEGE